MESRFTPDPDRAPGIGEWHMHCHVLAHMMGPAGGMMGSLKVINGGELAFPLALPSGVACPPLEATETEPPPDEAPMTATVRGLGTPCRWEDDVSHTPETTIKVGGTVAWTDEGCSPHTVIGDSVAPFDAWPGPELPTLPDSKVFNVVGDYGFHCGVHGGDPVSETGMYGIVHLVA